MVDVRAIKESEYEVWHALWTKYLQFYKSSVSEDIYKKTFERITSDSEPDQRGYFAIVEGRPVGLVHFLFHRHFWHIEQVTYMSDLFVDSSARKQGVGRTLIESVYKAANENGTPFVYWATQEFNSTARSLYDKIGKKTPFIEYERK